MLLINGEWRQVTELLDAFLLVEEFLGKEFSETLTALTQDALHDMKEEALEEERASYSRTIEDLEEEISDKEEDCEALEKEVARLKAVCETMSEEHLGSVQRCEALETKLQGIESACNFVEEITKLHLHLPSHMLGLPEWAKEKSEAYNNGYADGRNVVLLALRSAINRSVSDNHVEKETS